MPDTQRVVVLTFFYAIVVLQTRRTREGAGGAIAHGPHQQ